MSNNHSLTKLQISAALCEEIYRRSNSDDPLNISNLGLKSLDFEENSKIKELTLNISENDHYYYSTKGFVGRVVTDEATKQMYVVFRGTDSAESFLAGATKAISKGALNDLTVRNDPESNLSDLGDWGTNSLLGAYGTLKETQLEDALALTRAAKAIAERDGYELNITGQSLGGGLAGLVGAIEEVNTIVFAPAPFHKQLIVESTLKSILKNTKNLTNANIENIDFNKEYINSNWTPYEYYVNGSPRYLTIENAILSDSESYLINILKNNIPGITTEEINKILIDRNYLLAVFDSYVKVHTIKGETLSDGIAGGLGSLIGSTQMTNMRTSYDLGVESSKWLISNVADSLHGAALHNLVIRTESENQKFSELMRNNEFLRYALLENQEISGPLANNREDPTSPEYGGSGVNSSNDGATSAILFRSLWKSVGIENGLYDYFYTTFEKHLSSEAVQEIELRKGLTFLTLQMIRDNLFGENRNAYSSDVTERDYENTNIIGGLEIDLGHIKNGMINGEANQNIYGYAETNLGIKNLLNEYLSNNNIQNYGLKLQIDYTKWTTLVYGSDKSGLRYVADESQKDNHHVIIGNKEAQFSTIINNLIVASNKDDVIIGNSAKNFIDGGSGDDIIIGGNGWNTIFGGDGNDTIVAGTGVNQIIYGGNGDDYIVAVGAGKYYGNGGNDVFITSKYYSANGLRYINGDNGYDIAYIEDISSLWLHHHGVGIHNYSYVGIEEFRVGWSFDHLTKNWEQGSFGKIYSKDEIYEKIFVENKDYSQNFTNVSKAIISYDEFTSNQIISVFEGTIPPTDLWDLRIGDSQILINGEYYTLTAQFSGRNVKFFINTSEHNSEKFDFDLFYQGNVRIIGSYLDESTNEVKERYTHPLTFNTFSGIISKNYDQGQISYPPITDLVIAENASISVFRTETGVVFNTDHWEDGRILKWSVISSNGNEFHILPNGELHYVNPVIITNNEPLKIIVTVTDGINTITKHYALNENSIIEIPENSENSGEITGSQILYGNQIDQLDASLFELSDWNGGGLANWSLSGEGSENFIIDKNGRIFSKDKLKFTNLDQQFEITVHAKNNFNDISKVIFIKPSQHTNVVEVGMNQTVIEDTFRNDIIETWGTDKTIYTNGGYDTIISTYTKSTIIAKVTGDFSSGYYGAIYDIANVGTHAPNLLPGQDPISTGNGIETMAQGLITGGSGYDITYIHNFARTSVTFINGTAVIKMNNFAITGVEEFRVGWQRETGDIVNWLPTEYSNSYSEFDILKKAANGEIDGFNDSWKNITHSVSNESLQDSQDLTVVFRGELKSSPAGIVNGATIKINGITYAATVLIDNGIYTISVAKSAIMDVQKAEVFEGILHFDNAPSITFGGIIEDIYDLTRAPTQINGNDEFIAGQYNVFQGYQFFTNNAERPLTWSVSGEGSEHFTINAYGVLQAPNYIIPPLTFSLTITATDGFKTVTKDITIHPYGYTGQPVEPVITEILGQSEFKAGEYHSIAGQSFGFMNMDYTKPVIWSLSGTDAHLFTIQSGILMGHNLDQKDSYDITIHVVNGHISGSKAITVFSYESDLVPTGGITGTINDDVFTTLLPQDIFYGLAGNDTITANHAYGGSGNDTLTAIGPYAQLFGESGDDILIGSNGPNLLNGGSGNDIIYGGEGGDRIYGGEGADIFVYKAVSDSDLTDYGRNDIIFDLDDSDSFDFTELGEISFDKDNGPAGSIYAEIQWDSLYQQGGLFLDVDRDGTFDMGIELIASPEGLNQINFVNGPTYLLD